MAKQAASNLSKVMDNLGKLVGCFGLVSGLAYICGWVQFYFFLGKFNAQWAFDFSTPQFLIQKGMLWVLACCFVSAIILGLVRNILDAKGIGGLAIIGPSVPIMMSLVFFPSLGDFFARWVFPYLFMIYGALILAVGIRAAQDKQPPQVVTLMLLAALVWMVVVIPGLRANQEAGNLKSGAMELASVTSKDFRGMVISVIGDKLLLQDCISNKQLLIEPGGDWSVLPNSFWCK